MRKVAIVSALILTGLGLGWGLTNALFPGHGLAEMASLGVDPGGKPSEGLDLIASAARSEDAWTVSGRLLDDGEFVAGARVWLIGDDGLGHRVSPPGVTTNELGEFTISDVPVQIGAEGLRGNVTLTVFARTLGAPEEVAAESGQEAKASDDVARTATAELSVRALRRVSDHQLSLYWLFILVLLFVVSVGLALFDASGIFNRIKYYASVLLAFLLTGAMIGSISDGIHHVVANAGDTEVLSLGFGRIYKGTFVSGVQPEWIFSFTSPASEFTISAVDAGFGAPLWVILLSVIGAGLFTVSLIVKQMQDPIHEAASEGARSPLRDRVGEIIQHQFYIIFSPVGGVVVYQLQVAAGAASNQVVVGLAALAAGLAVNVVLEAALRTVDRLAKAARTGR